MVYRTLMQCRFSVLLGPGQGDGDPVRGDELFDVSPYLDAMYLLWGQGLPHGIPYANAVSILCVLLGSGQGDGIQCVVMNRSDVLLHKVIEPCSSWVRASPHL